MDELLELCARQDGVLSRTQALEVGVTDNDLRRLVRRRELVVVHPGVYVDHTGKLTWEQRAWAAVLFLWPAAVAGASAVSMAGASAERADAPIHVAIGRHRRVAAPPGIRVTRMEHIDEATLWNTSPPRLRLEEAALDLALEATSDFHALGVLAEVCQSRRTTAARLLGALRCRKRARRRAWLEAVLTDIAAGACSVLERGYLANVERAHGLPRAERQVRAHGLLGVAYRDVAYRGLLVELDGRLFHDSARQRDRDLDRDLDAAVDGRPTLRIGYGQVFERPCATAARIGAVLVRRGWSGELRPCGPGCVVGTARSVAVA